MTLPGLLIAWKYQIIKTVSVKLGRIFLLCEFLSVGEFLSSVYVTNAECSLIWYFGCFVLIIYHHQMLILFLSVNFFANISRQQNRFK